VGAAYRQISVFFFEVILMSATLEFALLLPTKSEKELNQLVDGLRIMFWYQFKSDYKEQVGKDKQFEDHLKLYEKFNQLWQNHPVKSMGLAEVKQFINNLQYSEQDVYQARKDYYEARRGFSATVKVDEIPFS
jgi:hypothetical protein